MTGPIRVLGVHGIGNYGWFRDAGSADTAAAALAVTWERALRRPGDGGDQSFGFTLEIAYYAHLLNRGTAQGNDPAQLEPGEQDLLIRWVEVLREQNEIAEGRPPRAELAQGPRTVRARQAAEWLTRHFGMPARAMVMIFCREVHTYLKAPDSHRRRAARDLVAEALYSARPDVVVAHSLGSVVAYEALSTLPEGVHVPLLVTIGSPLAMPFVVFDRLACNSTGGIRPRPESVQRWVNLADVGDIVAIPHGAVSRRFHPVELDLDVVIGPKIMDFHSAEGYLSLDTVRHQILTRGPRP